MPMTLTRTLVVLARALSSSGMDNVAVGLRSGKSSAITETLEARTLMSTYYVSTSGSDSNKGTSASAPWNSISKVNSVTLHPGDTVLFKGGETFSGSLKIGSNDSGTYSSPVTFGSYDGQATISSGTSSGATVHNASGIWFSDLKFVGKPGGASQSGINFQGYSGGVYYTNDRVEDCNISGYWTAGVLVEGSESNGGFDGLQITSSAIYNNVETGIQTCSAADTSLKNFYIAYNQVYNNYGDGVSTCTGSGIELGDVSSAMVEYNSAYLNGSRAGNGGVGIWAYSSNDVTFQYNQSYDNITTGHNDGDGFDFDLDVSNSVMQYNYAYGNDGTGAQLDQWKSDSDFNNDIVRYNVFVDNGRKNNYGNLEVWGNVHNAYLYNNVIVTTPGSSGSDSAIRVHNSTIPGLYVNSVHFVDNIIDTTGGATLINIPQAEAKGAKNLTFTGNVYWSNGSTATIIDGGKTLHSLAQWQAAGQENYDGKSYGVFANPDFVSVASPAVASSISGTASLATTAAAYQLQSDSPALSEKLSITAMYGIATGGKDFFGNSIASNATAIAGADQVVDGKSPTTPVKSPTSPTTTPIVSSAPVQTATPLPGLNGYEIGAGIKGSNSISNGTYTITTGGTDIWGTSDSFRFDETTLTGNGTIIAHVASEGDANRWSKAGVMIRGSNATAAAEVSMLLCPEETSMFQARSQPGGSTAATATNDHGDTWVKLVRSGNEFSGYQSADGVHWTLVSTTTVAMGSTVEIGLAVTAHDTTGSEKATFDNVSIT